MKWMINYRPSSLQSLITSLHRVSTVDGLVLDFTLTVDVRQPFVRPRHTSVFTEGESLRRDTGRDAAGGPNLGCAQQSG